jgi:hypothetical protein
VKEHDTPGEYGQDGVLSAGTTEAPMNRLRLALLLVLLDAIAGCSSGSNHIEAPNDAGTDAGGTPEDAGKVDAPPVDAGMDAPADAGVDAPPADASAGEAGDAAEQG